LLFTPHVNAAPVQESLFVETGTAERVLDADVEQGRGRFLLAVAAVQEPHVLVQDQVAVPHGVVVLRHQGPDLGVPAQEPVELFVGDVKPGGVAQRVLARVLALQQEALEHLPTDGPQPFDVLGERFVHVVRVDHRVDLERDLVPSAPLAHLVELGHVVGPTALPSADRPVRVGVERVARHGQHVHVLAVPVHPLLLDQTSVAHYRHADTGPPEFRFAVTDQLAHEPAAVPDERFASRKVQLLHTGFRQHGQTALGLGQRQYERRLGRVKAKATAVVALPREVIVDAERHGLGTGCSCGARGVPGPRDGRERQSPAHRVPGVPQHFEKSRVPRYDGLHRMCVCAVG